LSAVIECDCDKINPVFPLCGQSAYFFSAKEIRKGVW
jgi:hypothetical protein